MNDLDVLQGRLPEDGGRGGSKVDGENRPRKEKRQDNEDAPRCGLDPTHASDSTYNGLVGEAAVQAGRTRVTCWPPKAPSIQEEGPANEDESTFFPHRLEAGRQVHRQGPVVVGRLVLRVVPGVGLDDGDPLFPKTGASGVEQSASHTLMSVWLGHNKANDGAGPSSFRGGPIQGRVIDVEVGVAPADGLRTGVGKVTSQSAA